MKNSIFKLGFAFLFIEAVYVFYHIAVPLDMNAKETVFSVEKGQGSRTIAQRLEDGGFIRSAFFFNAYTLLRGAASKLQAGEYAVSRAYSIVQISNKFAAGDVIKNRITIIEGWNIKDIAQYLQEQGVASKEEILAFQHLEGRLFPDTYEVSPAAAAEELVTLMTDTFEKKVGAISKDALIMASILEKEVRGLEDKRIVSGILQKRLQVGMALQVDATINYITGKRDSQVSRADAAIDSPYNTYKYRGLPPGPISNPGLESIQAAQEPEKSPYWYYLSTPEGKTIFSKTSDEHAQAKAQYLDSK